MTHINAYQGNVAEKEVALGHAQAELDEAKRLLESHPDYEAPKKEKKEDKVEEPVEVKEVEVKKGTSLWQKK